MKKEPTRPLSFVDYGARIIITTSFVCHACYACRVIPVAAYGLVSPAEIALISVGERGQTVLRLARNAPFLRFSRRL